MALACDITQSNQVDQAFEAIATQWHTVKILVNNAGVTRDNFLFKMSDWTGTWLRTGSRDRFCVRR